MLLVGKNRLDLKGLEINKVINVPLEVTLQLRSILLSTNRWAISSTLANYNSIQQSHTGLCINICTYKHCPKYIPSFLHRSTA